MKGKKLKIAVLTVQLKLFSKEYILSNLERKQWKKLRYCKKPGHWDGLERKIQMMQKMQKRGIRKVQNPRAQLTSKLQLTESQR